MDLAQRPPYTEQIDFQALAEADYKFKVIYPRPSTHINFQDPAVLKTLTRAILKSHFDLTLELPPDRLCPPVPNRWNYIAWLHALLDSTSPAYTTGYDANRPIIGLDIGTGASAIYTLLCLRSRPTWTMCATDVDKESFDSAVRNLTINGLVTRTRMLQSLDEGPLIHLRGLGVEKLDFTICNPPFFGSEAEMAASMSGEGKGSVPSAVCTGAPVEMVYKGGDLGFVSRIVEESLVLREKVGWYTSLLGKLSSAKAIIDILKKKGITNWAVGCVDTRGATKRWIVAWSFGDLRPKNSVARLDKIANEYLPFPTEFRIPISGGVDMETAKAELDKQISSLDMRWTWDSDASVGIGEASQNVWKRAYRREHERKKREMGKAGEDASMGGVADSEVELAFRASFEEETKELILEWLRGRDQVLWESFCGMLHRFFKKS